MRARSSPGRGPHARFAKRGRYAYNGLRPADKQGKGSFAVKRSMFEGSVNCLFTVIALPLGLWLLGYGIYLLAIGDLDYGVFLALLGALLLGAIGSGLLRGRKPAGARRDGRGKKQRK